MELTSGGRKSLCRSIVPQTFVVPDADPTVFSGGIAVEPGEAKELGLVRVVSFSAVEGDMVLFPVQFLVGVAAPALDVVDEDADTVDTRVPGEWAPVEGDVGSIGCDEGGDVG